MEANPAYAVNHHGHGEQRHSVRYQGALAKREARFQLYRYSDRTYSVSHERGATLLGRSMRVRHDCGRGGRCVHGPDKVQRLLGVSTNPCLSAARRHQSCDTLLCFGVPIELRRAQHGGDADIASAEQHTAAALQPKGGMPSRMQWLRLPPYVPHCTAPHIPQSTLFCYVYIATELGVDR